MEDYPKVETMTIERSQDSGDRYWVTLRCAECDETWRTPAVTQYGATEYAQPECPVCGEPGEAEGR